MKRWIAKLMAIVMCSVLLAGCNTEKPLTETGDPTQPGAYQPDVPGKLYNTGEFQTWVPDGWAAFPVADAFADEADAVDTSCFIIIKDGTSDMDVFTKPYVRLDYFGPDTQMMKPSSEWYENVKDVTPVKLGNHSWSGFTGEDGYGKSAVLWAEAGNIQYQATIWLEVGGNTVSLDDKDVQAILAAVAPSGGTTESSTGPSTGNYEWWEKEWYGWWCIKNGTGTYAPASDIAWDAFAEIDVYNDNTGRVTLWDTGTSKDKPLIIAYDVTYRPGASALGCLESKRVVFFPQSVWNNGQAAVSMDERTVGWTIDPAASTVSKFADMLEIKGHYTSPDNSADSFDYYIYLRPWGIRWDDVRAGDTSGCLYKDMMPLYHDNWYVPLLDLGYGHPLATFEEGISILQNGSGNNSGAPLDPAAKANADGKVDMATLKKMLPWCKTSPTYSTTYEEIANMFGTHGKQLQSLFENIAVYRWIASEDNYIQISFNIHEDGSETWNVTQWQGIE